MDDQDFCGRSTVEVWTMLDIAQFMSTNAICGIPTENMKKLEPPATIAKLQGWGADFSAKTLFVPEDKRVRYLNSLDCVLKAPKDVSVATLSTLIGQMEFVAQLHRQMKPLFNVVYMDMKQAVAIALSEAKEACKTWGLSELKRFSRGPRGTQLVELSESSLQAILCFRNVLHKNEHVSAVELVRSAPFHCNLAFVSDASYEGIGAVDLKAGVCWNIGFGTSFHLSSLGVSEDVRARRFPIACLEALAAFIELGRLLQNFTPKSDQIADRPFALAFQDNQNWNSVMNKLRGKGCLISPAIALTELLCKNKAMLKSLYVPSESNIADGLTRANKLRTSKLLYKRHYPRSPALHWGKPIGWNWFFKAWRLLFPLEAEFRFSSMYRNMEITAFPFFSKFLTTLTSLPLTKDFEAHMSAELAELLRGHIGIDKAKRTREEYSAHWRRWLTFVNAESSCGYDGVSPNDTMLAAYMVDICKRRGLVYETARQYTAGILCVWKSDSKNLPMELPLFREIRDTMQRLYNREAIQATPLTVEQAKRIFTYLVRVCLINRSTNPEDWALLISLLLIYTEGKRPGDYLPITSSEGSPKALRGPENKTLTPDLVNVSEEGCVTFRWNREKRNYRGGSPAIFSPGSVTAFIVMSYIDKFNFCIGPDANRDTPFLLFKAIPSRVAFSTRRLGKRIKALKTIGRVPSGAKFSSYSFRRGPAISLYDLGIPFEVIQAGLRHKSSKTTAHYLNVKKLGHSRFREHASRLLSLGESATGQTDRMMRTQIQTQVFWMASICPCLNRVNLADVEPPRKKKKKSVSLTV